MSSMRSLAAAAASLCGLTTCVSTGPDAVVSTMLSQLSSRGYKCCKRRSKLELLDRSMAPRTTPSRPVVKSSTTPTKQQQTNFIENWKITNYITFPPANSL